MSVEQEKALGRRNTPIAEIMVNDKIISNSTEKANLFADFFLSKVKDLCTDKIDKGVLKSITRNCP